MSDDETIDAMLDNLARLRSDEEIEDDEDSLSIARQEVDRLFDEHDLAEHIDRDRVHVATARWKRKNGCCMYNRKLSDARYGKRVTKRPMEDVTGHHSIVINERIDDHDAMLDTVRHELAHVVAYVDPACGPHGTSPGHDRRWKQWARALGADPSACHNKKESEYKYWFGCPNGCWKGGRYRRSKKIKHPKLYRCNQCEETLVSWTDGSERPEEPGVSVS